MKCEKIREIILTDYLDGTISAEQKRLVQEHLRQCAHCRELEEFARKDILDTFSAIPKAEVPQNLWHNIKAEIENEHSREVKNPLYDLLDKLRGFWVLPKPAFALATAMSVIIVAVVFGKFHIETQKIALNDYLEEQVAFLAYLDSDEYYENSDLNLETSIEEYLL